MPYLLGLLGMIVTIVVLLNRLADAGIDLGGLNPFLLRRRRAWRQKFEANPIFSLEEPMEVAAVLAVGVAKADGDMSAEQKQALLMSFERTLGLDRTSSQGSARLQRAPGGRRADPPKPGSRRRCTW